MATRKGSTCKVTQEKRLYLSQMLPLNTRKRTLGQNGSCQIGRSHIPDGDGTVYVGSFQQPIQISCVRASTVPQQVGCELS